MMILSLAHAPVEEASRDNLFGAWSDLVVGDRPNGLIDCYLLEDEDVVQVAAIWESAEAHDRAIGKERTHPAFVVFEASGLDPTHSVFSIVGRLGN